MKPTIFLRIASVLTFIHAVMHTVGGVFGPTAPGPATVAVQAMKVNQFLLMGHTRSYWDFYRGLGLGISVFLTFEAIIFWQLSSLARTGARRLRPILSTFLIAYLALAVNSNTYFFFGPILAEILIAACLGAAIFTSESRAEEQTVSPSEVFRRD
jgi:glycerol uptake facilitator-like aquaporin